MLFISSILQMIELDISVSPSHVKGTNMVRGADMIEKHSGKYGSICLVVRRPGCFFCRQQALTLSVLAALYPDMDGFRLFAVVKETGVDDHGLIEYYDKYFTFPTYCDKSWALYTALGNRRVGFNLLWNPSSVFSILCESAQSLRAKSVDDSANKGEGLVQGGIVFIGSDGKPKYAYQEETAVQLRVGDILAAIDAIKQQSSS
jgi:hypothetical protein